MLHRPSWEQVWMDIAQVMARRSRCVRRQVGAVIVDTGQRIVASGYNGPPAGLGVRGPCSDWCPRARGSEIGPGYDNCYTSHAEMNTVAFADRSRMEGGTLYSTSAVCFACAKVIANSGIARVLHVVVAEDAHRLPEESETLMTLSGLDVVRWTT